MRCDRTDLASPSQWQDRLQSVLCLLWDGAACRLLSQQVIAGHVNVNDVHRAQMLFTHCRESFERRPRRDSGLSQLQFDCRLTDFGLD